MEVKVNGIVALIKDVFRNKEKEIKDRCYEKHQELKKKIEKTPEYQKLAMEISELEKQRDKLNEKINKLEERIGRTYWDYEKKVLERLNREFIKVRIAVMGKDAEEVKSAITEFSNMEFWEG
ncbi:MAG: hypothetical protein ABIL68_07315 [bacterium]